MPAVQPPGLGQLCARERDVTVSSISSVAHLVASSMSTSRLNRPARGPRPAPGSAGEQVVSRKALPLSVDEAPSVVGIVISPGKRVLHYLT